MSNFIEQYLDYFANTETPTIYDRWCCIAGIGALLGRRCWVTHGHNKIYPNQYVMLVGESGARKSTAISRTKQLLTKIGYNTIAAEKTSKEKLLMDMEAGLDKMDNDEAVLDVRNTTKNPIMKNLFPELELNSDPSECLICADEANAFLGHGNTEFIDLLTQLWDYNDIYKSRIKTGRSVRIPFPTINIMFGNTNVGISQSFPPEVIGQGFFARLIMVHSNPTGRRIAWPPSPDDASYIRLCKALEAIKAKMVGEIKVDKEAYAAIKEIYETWQELPDARFKSYSTRRFTHLLKLCIVCTGSFGETIITERTVIYANSILHYTEYFMPKALGEFGKAKNSDVSAKILDMLEDATAPKHVVDDVWKLVSRDLDNQKQMMDIINNLRAAGKVQVVGTGLLPKKTPPSFKFPFTDVTLLREYLQSPEAELLP